MAKHIGIVACSAEGAALCYRTICMEAPQFMGEHSHPEITMHTHPLSEYMEHIRKGEWEEVGRLMLSSTHKVVQAGSEFAICPDNTIHEAFQFVISRSPIPWLHIAETVAKEAKKKSYAHIGIMGTKYLMTGPVYPEVFKKAGMLFSIPDEKDRERIDRVIFEELVNGIFREESRHYFNDVIERLKEGGCDTVVLGCTELPLIVNPKDCPLPTLDSTRLLARAALYEAIGKEFP
ncbi:MAG: amino acid racemase [Deltaproteobacteria bacterium]|nr:amino acid racemase [Deltaproteobacteria bacterium]MBW2137386.1 amino acid racemase [Deltaproteobacteria bacterium]